MFKNTDPIGRFLQGKPVFLKVYDFLGREKRKEKNEKRKTKRAVKC
jgi:hypothetical protein